MLECLSGNYDSEATPVELRQMKEEDDGINVRFKSAVICLNACNNETRRVLIVTDEFIYLFEENKLFRTNSISSLKGIVVSIAEPYEVLLAFGSKDIRFKVFCPQKMEELYSLLQERFNDLDKRTSLKHCYKVAESSLQKYFCNRTQKVCWPQSSYLDLTSSLQSIEEIQQRYNSGSLDDPIDELDQL